jgi:hypothetical protein
MAKKTVTLTLAEKARKIAESHKAEVVYANSKDELFTRKDLALNSEGGDKSKVQTFDFGNAADNVEPEDKSGDE